MVTGEEDTKINTIQTAGAGSHRPLRPTDRAIARSTAGLPSKTTNTPQLSSYSIIRFTLSRFLLYSYLSFYSSLLPSTLSPSHSQLFALAFIPCHTFSLSLTFPPTSHPHSLLIFTLSFYYFSSNSHPSPSNHFPTFFLSLTSLLYILLSLSFLFHDFSFFLPCLLLTPFLLFYFTPFLSHFSSFRLISLFTFSLSFLFLSFYSLSFLYSILPLFPFSLQLLFFLFPYFLSLFLSLHLFHLSSVYYA